MNAQGEADGTRTVVEAAKTPAAETQAARGRPGRRPGGADTRQEILAAARAEVAARGYESTRIGAIAAARGLTRPQVRAELAMTQIVGIIMGRYMLTVEPLATATIQELMPLLATTLERYMIK